MRFMSTLTVHVVACEQSFVHLHCGKFKFFLLQSWLVKLVKNVRTFSMHVNTHLGMFSLPDPPLSSLHHHLLLLVSPDQGQVIFVYGADYGRQDKTTCSFGRPNGQVQNTVCSGSASASRVADRYTLTTIKGLKSGACVHTRCSYQLLSLCIHRCNGKQSCVIRSSNRVFGDPCVGTYKYLQVAYVCECKYLFKGPFGCYLFCSPGMQRQVTLLNRIG